MNRTKIEWTDYTWNPITGCSRGCSYCYAAKMALRLAGRCGYAANDPFKPTFHAERLNEPLECKKPSKIFAVSMGDFFDPAVPEEWREEVYKVMDRTPRHTYLVLTKQVPIEPESRATFPKNLWLGVSVDGTSDYWKHPLASLQNSSAVVKFVSFEPVLGNVFPDDLSCIDWAIIGAQTGIGAKAVNQEYVRRLVNIIKSYKVPMFIKTNIENQIGTFSREFPKNLIETISREQLTNKIDPTCVDYWI